MRLRTFIALAGIIAAWPAPAAQAEISLDQYFALRRQHRATSLQVLQLRANPESCWGRVLELRGTISGFARTGGDTSIILECGDGSFVVSATDLPDAPSGSRVCALVQVGESSTAYHSDLRLIAVAYECRVVERERKAIEAEVARQAAEKQRKLRLQNQPARGSQNRAPAQPVSLEQLIGIYKQAVRSFNKTLTNAEADAIARSILGFSAHYRVDPRLVVAVILAESHFRPEATSPKGAMGLGQLMPGTAAGLGVGNAYDPVANIQGSVRLIKGHLDRLSGGAAWTELTWRDLSLALASYNAGPGAVKKYGGIPPYRETQGYIKRVLSYYRRLCGIEG